MIRSVDLSITITAAVPRPLRAARRLSKSISMSSHIAFGSILGEDRKMMKTRSGENVELGGLLNEAVERALAVVTEKKSEMKREL